MSLAPLVWIAGWILLAGGLITLGVRALIRRGRSSEARRLSSLGVVESHKHARPRE